MNEKEIVEKVLKLEEEKALKIEERKYEDAAQIRDKIRRLKIDLKEIENKK